MKTTQQQLRADFERRYGRPLRLSDERIAALVAARRPAEPATLPLRLSPDALDRADARAPRVSLGFSGIHMQAEERFTEEQRRRILALHGNTGQPVHVSSAELSLLSELDPGAHLAPSPDGEPTYGRHEREGR
jgi:hypothetical protein